MRELLENTTNRLFSEQLTPEVILAAEGGNWLGTLWQSIDELGFCAVAAPENRGGLGAQWKDIYPIVRAAGYHNAPIPLVETIFANWLLGYLGVDALVGPISFSVSHQMTLTDGKLTGEVTHVPWGRHVDHCLIILEVEGKPYCAIIHARDVSSIDEAYNIAREPRDTLHVAGADPVVMVPLPADLPATILSLGGAMMRSAQIGGGLQCALDLAITYCNDRVQFGRPIMKFQAVQHQVSILAEQVAMMMIAGEAVFYEWTENVPVHHIRAAKVCSGLAVTTAAPLAHAVHGAIGFTHEYSLHLTTRRLMSWANEFGSTTEWAQDIGKTVCHHGSDKFWPRLVAGII